MGAPKTPSTTTQISKVELPAWVDKASQENYQFAQDIANKPLQQYQGQTIAGTSADTSAAYDLARNSVGSTWAAGDAAQGAIQGTLGYQPDQVTSDRVAAGSVTAGQLADTDLSRYINPFVDNVESKALGALNDSRIQSLMGNKDAAIKSKAFGGSRSGIVDGITNSQTAKAAGVLSAGLRKDAFDTATTNATADINRRLQADTDNRDASLSADLSNQGTSLQARIANQTAGLTANGQRITGALASNTLSNDSQMRDLKDYGLLVGQGADQQAQAQKYLDADAAKFYEARDYDTERLNILLSSLGMSPYGKTETTKTTGRAGSSGTDWASVGSGVASILPALFGLSDENMKTDIEKLGKDEDTGLDMYAYRYKGDPKSYPKVVGPMAQDIGKKFPGRTKKIDGKMVVKLHG